MSNFASLRNQVLMSTSIGSSLSLERRQEVFDAAWAACRQDETKIGDTYTYMLKAIGGPAPAPAVTPAAVVVTPVVPAPTTIPRPSGITLDMGALQVIVDTLSASLLPGSPYVFDGASRRAVRDELLAGMRKANVILLISPTSNAGKTATDV